MHIIVDNYTRAVYARPRRFKSEAVEAFKAFRGAAENESGKSILEIMIDNARELSIGEMRNICEGDGINMRTMVP